MEKLIISDNRLIAAGLLVGILLIFSIGLSMAGRWKPKEPYTITEQDGVLRIRKSRSVVIYYLAVATVLLLVHILIIVFAIIAFWPLNKYQWAGITIIGLPGLVGYAVFVYFILPTKWEKWDAFDYVFERGRNRFLSGDAVVSAVSNIKNLQLHRKQTRETSKTSYVLSVILKDAQPHFMYELEDPAVPLFKLSEKVAKYLNVEIHQAEVLVVNGQPTGHLAVFVEVLLLILGIVGVVLLAMRD